MYLYRGMVFLRSWVTRDCLKCMGKVPVDRKRFTMVVIIGRIVAETCFRRKVTLIKIPLFNRCGIREFSDFVNRCRRK